MSQIKPKDTLPEMRVRKVAHALGYRFRLHRKNLPGKPDLVFPRLKLAVFVHGCFWHRHPGCKKAGTPKSKVDFWEEKFRRNVARDADNVADLEGQGWRVRVIWECQTKNADELTEIVRLVLTGLSPQKPDIEPTLRRPLPRLS